MAAKTEASTGRGHEALPDTQRKLMAKAVRLEWITLLFKVVTIPLVGVVAGQSQAMRTAWYEDILELLPPIAFLIAARQIRREPDLQHPYGHHRSIGIGHLVAATALFAMGVYLLIDSALSLLGGERPPIGTVVLFGHSIWLGWLMMIVMFVSALGPVILGRMKLRLVEDLPDKVLYADADMNKADWMTAVATIVGLLGVGYGLWWMDAATAMAVSVSIIHDGVTNLRSAVGGLTDAQPKDVHGKKHGAIDKAINAAASEPWVQQAAGRFRDMGHVLHAEVFVVPVDNNAATLDNLAALRTRLEDMDYQLHDVVVIPVESIPHYLREG